MFFRVFFGKKVEKVCIFFVHVRKRVGTQKRGSPYQYSLEGRFLGRPQRQGKKSTFSGFGVHTGGQKSGQKVVKNRLKIDIFWVFSKKWCFKKMRSCSGCRTYTVFFVFFGGGQKVTFFRVFSCFFRFLGSKSGQKSAKSGVLGPHFGPHFGPPLETPLGKIRPKCL